MKVAFDIDTQLLNQHLAASSHDATRTSIMNTVAFRSQGDKMDIVSTNGRIMFWTKVDAPVVDGVAVNWDAVSVRFNVNGKKVVQERRGKLVGVTLDMDARKCEVNDWSLGSVMMFPFNDVPFPQWEQVANTAQKSSKPSVYEPNLLKIVKDYVGTKFPSPEGTMPERWVQESSNEKRVAFLMPLGGSMNNAKSLANRMVESIKELVEGSAEVGGYEVMKRVLGIAKEYVEVNPYEIDDIIKDIDIRMKGGADVQD